MPVSIPEETTVSPLAIENSTYSSTESDKEHMNATTVSSVPSSSTHMSLEGVDYRQSKDPIILCFVQFNFLSLSLLQFVDEECSQKRELSVELRLHSVDGHGKFHYDNGEHQPIYISAEVHYSMRIGLFQLHIVSISELSREQGIYCSDILIKLFLFKELFSKFFMHFLQSQLFSVPPSDLLLRLGEYDLSIEEEPYGYQERRVQIVASHPQFDPRTFEYDLALLR